MLSPCAILTYNQYFAIIPAYGLNGVKPYMEYDMKYNCKTCGKSCEAGSFEEIMAKGKLCDKCDIEQSSQLSSLRRVFTKTQKKIITGKFRCCGCGSLHPCKPYVCECGSHSFRFEKL
jgi:hypothetical protein